MTLHISHITATQCWKSARFDALLDPSGEARRSRPVGAVELARAATNRAQARARIPQRKASPFEAVLPGNRSTGKPLASDVKALSAGSLAFASKPLHAAVSNGAERNGCKNLVCHTCSQHLPPGSFVRMADNAFLAAPELCFLQMASILTLQDLVKLGIELCSTYSLEPNGTAGYGRPVPPTSTHALGRYLGAASGLPGVDKSRQAFRHVVGVSGSPMETMLVMMLCLPPRLGGYGLPHPSMNHRIDARTSDRRRFEKHYYLCDLYWPGAKLCVEYDSDQEHTGSDRIAQDALRRNDLTHRGVTVVTVTRKHLANPFRLERLAHQLAQTLHVRIRTERGWTLAERGELLRSLAKTS